MVAKGALVKILQRRLGIDILRTAAIGDSRQDSSMFSSAGLSIAFNTRHPDLVHAADVHVREKDLMLVSEAILDWRQAMAGRGSDPSGMGKRGVR